MLREQRLRPLEVAFGAGSLGLGSGQLRLKNADSVLEIARVDLHQQLPLLHSVSRLDCHRV